MSKDCGIFSGEVTSELCNSCDWASIKMALETFWEHCDRCREAGGLCDEHRKEVEKRCAVKKAEARVCGS